MDDAVDRIAGFMIDRIFEAADEHHPHSVQRMLANLPSDEKRLEWIYAITAGMCRQCGCVTNETCHCWNEE